MIWIIVFLILVTLLGLLLYFNSSDLSRVPTKDEAELPASFQIQPMILAQQRKQCQQPAPEPNFFLDPSPPIPPGFIVSF